MGMKYKMLEENSMSNINNKDKPGKYDTEEKRLAILLNL